jgi:hypothetical protein
MLLQQYSVQQKKNSLSKILKSLDVAQKLTDDLMSEIETIIETKPTLAQY